MDLIMLLNFIRANYLSANWVLLKSKKSESKCICYLNVTSDAGSQYRCGRVGRGIQPPSTPHAPPPTHIPKKISKTLVFPLFDSWVTDRRTDGRTDGRTDKASCRVACPQLKKEKKNTKTRKQNNRIKNWHFFLPKKSDFVPFDLVQLSTFSHMPCDCLSHCTCTCQSVCWLIRR